jgi:hypothetical protein
MTMKLWFDYCNLSGYMIDDSNVKFGIGWYRHSKDHKWFGLTIQFYMLYWLVNIHFVDNYAEYDKKVNYYLQPEYIKKREEKIAKWKASQDKK